MNSERTKKEQRVLFLLEKKRRKCLQSYFEFFKYFWPEVSGEPLIANWHIEFICDELQKVGELVINRLPKEYDLIINVPPGSSKSTMATVLFPVWLWANDPTLQVISGAYSATLSIKHSTDSRTVIRSERFQELFRGSFEMRRDEDAKTFYRNTKGGYRLATSTGASVTGQHGHVIIVDDPIDPKGVKSDVVLEGVNEWMDKTLSSRKVDKENTPTILIMQRLHEDDPTGNWLSKRDEGGKKVRHICLPATSDFDVQPEEAKENYIDGYLDPVRLGPGVLKEAKTDLGSKDFAGQFGQSPRPLEGNLILRSYLQVVSPEKLPAYILRDLVRDIVADTAFKEKQQNDPSGFLAYTTHKNYLFLTGWRKGRWAFPDLIAQLKQFVSDEGSSQSRVSIEPKASGVSVVQTLQNTTALNVFEWEMITGDKVERVNSILPFLEAKKVFLIRGPWTDDFIDECLVFPNGKHDEAVDCLVMACVNAFVRKKESGYTFYKAE